MDERLVNLGNFIKEKRKEKSLTLTEIDDRYGLDYSNWSKIENAKFKTFPKFDTLQRIAEILEINIIELYKIAGYLTDEDIEEYKKKED